VTLVKHFHKDNTMCIFLSAIVLQSHEIVRDPEHTDSHEDLIESRGLVDNGRGAFVRVELVPKGLLYEVDKYVLRLDQNNAPDWWTANLRDHVESVLRDDVRRMIVANERECLLGGCWILVDGVTVKRAKNARIIAMYGSSRIGTMLGSSHVGTMHYSSSVGAMYGSSSVGTMLGSSSVGAMYGSSSVGAMYGSSHVGTMHYSSSVGAMYGSSSVGAMYGSSSVGAMYGSSSVGAMYGSSRVGAMYGSSHVGTMHYSSSVGAMYGSSRIKNDAR